MRTLDAHAHLWTRSVTPQPWIDPESMRKIDRDFSVADLAEAQAESGIEGAVVPRRSRGAPVALRPGGAGGAASLVALACRAHPKTTFILDHLGKPPLLRGDLSAWRNDLAALAALNNVVETARSLFSASLAVRQVAWG